MNLVLREGGRWKISYQVNFWKGFQSKQFSVTNENDTVTFVNVKSHRNTYKRTNQERKLVTLVIGSNLYHCFVKYNFDIIVSHEHILKNDCILFHLEFDDYYMSNYISGILTRKVIFCSEQFPLLHCDSYGKFINENYITGTYIQKEYLLFQ